MTLPTPYILKEILLELDGTSFKSEFQCWITGYGLNSNAATTTDVTPLCPQVGTIALQGAPGAYTLTLDMLSDWKNPDSLSWFLVNHSDATDVKFTLIDRAGTTDGGVKITGVISSMPAIQAGGASGSASAFTGVIFALAGKPTLVPATAAGALASVTTSAGGGTVGPLGATRPANLAALQGDTVIGDGGTAAPSGDTPIGEFLMLADKSMAHYKTNAWVVGKATA